MIAKNTIGYPIMYVNSQAINLPELDRGALLHLRVQIEMDNDLINSQIARAFEDRTVDRVWIKSAEHVRMIKNRQIQAIQSELSARKARNLPSYFMDVARQRLPSITFELIFEEAIQLRNHEKSPSHNNALSDQQEPK